MKWKTFDGREVDTQVATHQHLSNCIWYLKLVMGYPLSSCAECVAAIVERFDNKILPYRPIPWSNDEIRTLIDRGLVYLNDLGDVLIIVNKKVIGEILKVNRPI
jgi:hypothetical protein